MEFLADLFVWLAIGMLVLIVTDLATNFRMSEGKAFAVLIFWPFMVGYAIGFAAARGISWALERVGK